MTHLPKVPSSIVIKAARYSTLLILAYETRMAAKPLELESSMAATMEFETAS